MTIEQLLRRAQTGDNHAFGALQKELQPRMERFIRRMIRNHADVEDIVQRTFIALYMNIERIDPPEKLMPFLYRVARNQSYDLLRQYYRRDEIDLDDVEYRLSGRSQGLEEKAHWSLMVSEVQACIDELPDIHRETLILYVEEQLSQNEIADIMQTSMGTVKSRLHYARKMLRSLVPVELQDTLREIRPSKIIRRNCNE